MHPISDQMRYKTKWTIRRYLNDEALARGEAYNVSEIDGNLLLNEGIQEAWDLIAGLGAPAAFNNANARIGVGDSAVAESAAHTGLQAAANKLYKAMSATYPQRAGQTVTWRAAFAGAEANFAWNEFTVANGADDNAKNLNRKVSAQGTKTAGQTWTVDLQITLS